MANCHDQFSEFNEDIQITSSKRKSIIKSKNKLRRRIRKHFAEHHPEYKPKFYIQGSRKMGTMIRTKDDLCDLDDGVYFLREPDVSGTTLQKWVLDAVDGHTSTDPQHRKKCIRVIFAGDYWIDLPVLYIVDDEDHPHLAVKNEDWGDDDPKEFVEWFNVEKKNNDQLVRLVRYMKAWGDNHRHKMPSGLVMTLLVHRNLRKDDRDDVAITDTLKAIRSSLNFWWSCSMPTWPYDDLLSDYPEERKDNFMDALDEFIDDAEEALSMECPREASKNWRRHLGGRFPLAEEDETESAKAKELRAITSLLASGNAVTSGSGEIKPSTENGTPHKPHRFYGE